MWKSGFDVKYREWILKTQTMLPKVYKISKVLWDDARASAAIGQAEAKLREYEITPPNSGARG